MDINCTSLFLLNPNYAKYFKSHNKLQKQGLERKNKKASKDYPYRLIFYTI